MLVSTFELLVKDQLPKEIPLPAPFDQLRRTVVQGYFLTVSNLGREDLSLILEFTALTPLLDIEKTVTYLDVRGNNIQGDLIPDTTAPRKARFNFTLNSQDTGLFILQPDIVSDGGMMLKDGTFEVRGYVEIKARGNNAAKREILVTAEHRGTFFNSSFLQGTSSEVRLDQFVSVLPLANGSSLYSLNGAA